MFLQYNARELSQVRTKIIVYYPTWIVIMAASATVSSYHGVDEPAFPARKRLKTSELPLNSAQRSSIDGLLHTMKKKGEYDTLRKQVWSQFTEDEEKAAFTKSLHELAEAEIDRDPSLLSRDRGKAATLMQGAVDRSDIYKSVEKTLDELIAKNIDHILKAGREIRIAEVGKEVAAEEEKRGSKSDEQYAQEIAIKRHERIRARKQEEARKRREDEKEALRAEEAQKMKELERLRSQDERRREREAIRAKREAARRKIPEPTKDDLEREKENTVDKLNTQDQPTGSPITPAPPVDEKALEEAALALLLQEGREAAAKNVPKVDRERSESPVSKPHISPPKGPAAMRARDPTRPRLGFSGHQSSSMTPHPPAPSRSRSPFYAPSSRRERSRSTSRTRQHSHPMRDDDVRREVESDAQIALKAQIRAKHDVEMDAYDSRVEAEYHERRASTATERDPRDKEYRSRKYDHGDYDYKESRDSYRRKDERNRSPDKERSHYGDRSSYTRPPREEAPEHIDRYVPGGAVPRDRDRDRDRIKGRDRHGERDRYGEKDRYGERERYGDKDKHGDRDRYSEKDKHSDRDRYGNGDRYADRDKHRDRSSDSDHYRDKDIKDTDTRDQDTTERDSHRESGRDRGSYYDTDRQRQYYKKDDGGGGGRSDYRERDRGSDRPRDRDRARDGYRERDRRDERPYNRPIRTDEPPEHIDRYVPGK